MLLTYNVALLSILVSANDVLKLKYICLIWESLELIELNAQVHWILSPLGSCVVQYWQWLYLKVAVEVIARVIALIGRKVVQREQNLMDCLVIHGSNHTGKIIILSNYIFSMW